MSQMSVKGKDLSVKVIRTEVVAPEQRWHDPWLPFSNLDLLVPPFDVGSFFCYNKPEHTIDVTTTIDALKTSLSRALALYYPLAGEIVLNAAAEPEIHCNNRGVDFVEATADIELRELNFYNPDESIEGKLMPKKENGVLAIQITMLKCGGMVIGCLFDHRAADGYSANMFISCWAAMTRSQTVSQFPSFGRSILNPRCPSVYTKSVADLFLPISDLPSLQNDSKNELEDSLMSRIYYIEGDQLKRLQSVASENGRPRSKLESFTSFLWKITASFLEDSGDDSHTCAMGVAVDGRKRLSEGDGDEKGKLMAAHFGNVLSIPFGRMSLKELNDKPLSWVANKVHDFLKNATTKEHFMALIDWVEDQKPKPLISRSVVRTENAFAIIVSSGQWFLIMEKVDFGWGKPIFGSCHVPSARSDCYVMTMASPIKDEDWIVYMHLPKKHLNYMEAHASNLFKPLTSDYLKL